MKKILFTLFIAFALILSIPTTAHAITNAKGIILDGQQVKMNTLPIIDNGRTLVPIRGVLEAMGAKVTWDQSSKTVEAYYEGKLVSVSIDRFIAYVDGNEVLVEVPAKLVDGRTMVPIRFMAEAIGFDVSYSEGWIYLDKIENVKANNDELLLIAKEFEKGFNQGLNKTKEDLDIICNIIYDERANTVIVSIISDDLVKAFRYFAKNNESTSLIEDFINGMIIAYNELLQLLDDYGYKVNVLVQLVGAKDSNDVCIEVDKSGFTYDIEGYFINP